MKSDHFPLWARAAAAVCFTGIAITSGLRGSGVGVSVGLLGVAVMVSAFTYGLYRRRGKKPD